MEEVQFYLDDAADSMNKAINHVSTELTRIRAGKANPGMLDGIKVEYYGTLTPLNQVAAVNTQDARTIVIKPFEKKLLGDIERVIRDSDLGISPQNDGELVRLSIPPLTEERRKQLAKQSKNEGEEGKVRIRNIRKETNDELKKLQKDGVSEDVIKDAEAKVQKLTDSFIAKIDDMVLKKEQEIMTI